jgi:hypothetical protein
MLLSCAAMSLKVYEKPGMLQRVAFVGSFRGDQVMCFTEVGLRLLQLTMPDR